MILFLARRSPVRLFKGRSELSLTDRFPPLHHGVLNGINTDALDVGEGQASQTRNLVFEYKIRLKIFELEAQHVLYLPAIGQIERHHVVEPAPDSGVK